MRTAFLCFRHSSALAEQCDAVFVHSSTESHFQVVSELLNAGCHVHVDKPLAASYEQSEALVSLAEKTAGTDGRVQPALFTVLSAAQRTDCRKSGIDPYGQTPQQQCRPA